MLLEVHTLVHLKNGGIWSTMENPPGSHDELLAHCDLHLVYMGRRQFVELVKRKHPLIIVNEDTDIKTIELGHLMFDELETLNYVIYRGLGMALGLGENQQKKKKKNKKIEQCQPLNTKFLKLCRIQQVAVCRAQIPGTCFDGDNTIDHTSVSVPGTDSGISTTGDKTTTKNPGTDFGTHRAVDEISTKSVDDNARGTGTDSEASVPSTDPTAQTAGNDNLEFEGEHLSSTMPSDTVSYGSNQTKQVNNLPENSNVLKEHPHPVMLDLQVKIRKLKVKTGETVKVTKLMLATLPESKYGPKEEGSNYDSDKTEIYYPMEEDKPKPKHVLLLNKGEKKVITNKPKK